MIPIWDIWVRLFHWTLVFAVLFLLFSGETSIGFFEWHRQIGELVLALILFRLLWGVVGSSNARLTRLFSDPRHALHHLLELLKGRADQERGHNAAGGWAVLAMLVLIGFQAVSGMFIADEEEFIEGAFYGNVSSDWTALLFKLHKANADLIQIIVSIHVAMVFIYLLYAKRNLITPMFTGKMNWVVDSTSDSASQPPAVSIQHWAVGLVIVLVLGTILVTQFW